MATVSTMHDVAADDEHGQPDRQPVREAEAGQRQHDERRDEQQLVGHRIEPGAEARLLARPARDRPSSASVMPAVTNTTSAQPRWP